MVATTNTMKRITFKAHIGLTVKELHIRNNVQTPQMPTPFSDNKNYFDKMFKLRDINDNILVFHTVILWLSESKTSQFFMRIFTNITSTLNKK